VELIFELCVRSAAFLPPLFMEYHIVQKASPANSFENVYTFNNRYEIVSAVIRILVASKTNGIQQTSIYASVLFHRLSARGVMMSAQVFIPAYGVTMSGQAGSRVRRGICRFTNSCVNYSESSRDVPVTLSQHEVFLKFIMI